jgi:hypothetical protein
MKSRKIIGDRQPQLTCRHRHRRCGEPFTSAASSVWARNNEWNAIASLVQRE